MVKYKFVIVLVLMLVGFGGWSYSTYQLQIVQNNNTAMAAELEELKGINAEQKRIADLLEAQIQAEKDDEAAMQAEFEKLNKPYPRQSVSEYDREKYSIDAFSKGTNKFE